MYLKLCEAYLSKKIFPQIYLCMRLVFQLRGYKKLIYATNMFGVINLVTLPILISDTNTKEEVTLPQNTDF